MASCKVCGSSAPIMRVSKAQTIELCYYHEAVCSAHLLDPCPKCDGGETEVNDGITDLPMRTGNVSGIGE